MTRTSGLIEHSLLRRADPRTKLVISLAASSAVTLPIIPLLAFASLFGILLWTANLVQPAVTQLWRARTWLLVVFALDCVFVGLEFACLITLRLALLSSAFIVVFATTTAEELRLAGEKMRMPPRVAFAFATAFRSLGLIEREWEGIVEAQRARGVVIAPSSPRNWRVTHADFKHALSLLVPAIVLTAQRAWSISEAAALRGLESPNRLPFRSLQFGALDHVLLLATAAAFGGSMLLR